MPYLRYKVVPCRRRRKLKATACFLEFCFYFHVVVHFRKDKSLRLQYFTFVGDLWCTIEKIRSESFRKCSFCKSAQNIPSIMLRVINKAPVLLGHNTPDYDLTYMVIYLVIYDDVTIVNVKQMQNYFVFFVLNNILNI